MASKSKKAVGFTALNLKERVKRRHPLDKGWFTVTELCPVSGMGGSAGRMDAAAVCLYTSRSFAVHGFEVKVDRSDWLTELNDPSKNSLGLEEVDYWWIVAPSTDVVRVSELPKRWGLYTCSGRGLRVTRRAERLKDEDTGFSRAFVVSLLWKVTRFKTPNAEALKELDRLKCVMEEFEERAGVSMRKYDAGTIGDIARAVRSANGRDRLRRSIRSAMRSTSVIDVGLRSAVEEIAKLDVDVAERRTRGRGKKGRG